MIERDYHPFRKEFDELIKRHKVDAYAFVMIVAAEQEDAESHTVVLSRVTPEEEVWVFMEKTRQLLFGLARTLLEIANPFFRLGPEAMLGMLHGIITDVSDECTAKELEVLAQEEEFLNGPRRSKKAKSEWH